MEKKKILILGGGHAEIPLICVAQEQGYYVITTGNQKEGLGHMVSDEFINLDFSDKEKMLYIAKENKVSAICSGCNDFALLSTAYVAEQLCLPGHDSYATSVLLHHKDSYRELAEKNYIPTPKAIRCYKLEEVEQAIEKLGYPIMIKPVDLTGGKGIKKCVTFQEAKEAFCRAMEVTREECIIVEEFIEGTNHGFTAMIQNGNVTFYFADNEQYYLNKYLVSGAVTPTSVPKEVIQKVIEYAEKVAQTLKLVDGILHIQYILASEDKPIILEICRRAPGDLYIRFVELATGFNYPLAILKAEMGIAEKEYHYIQPKAYWIRHCIMAENNGIVEDVVVHDEIKEYIVEKMIWAKKGDYVEEYLKYKAGIVFLRFSNEMQLKRYENRLNELIKLNIK